VLALVGQGRLQKRRRGELGYVRLGRGEIDEAAVVLDLVVGTRIEQVLDDIDVLGVEDIPRFELALGVSLDGEQLGRVGGFE
jgi:hypothetical protein